MNKYLIALVILVILISAAATGYLLFKSNMQNRTAQNQAGQNSQNVSSIKSKNQVIPAETVTLTSAGFNPQTLTIKAGERVVWLNNSGVVGTVNSDNYPTNLLYPFLNFGQFDNDSSFSTIFTKPGTYTYYNYLSQNQSQRGTIIVN